MKKRIQQYLRLIAFSHTIFAMPFALVGFSLGVREGLSFSEHSFSPVLFSESYSMALLWRLVLVVGCMVFARSAAMAFNRYLDRSYDARNPRTAGREIPSGLISPSGALLFTVVNALLFVGCTFFINPLCFYLSPVALGVILGYSYTKRFTSLCHLVLGVGLSLAPIGAYLAVTGQFAVLPILFSLLVLCWVSGFDIIYSLQDEVFDRSQQLFSIPVWLGKPRALQLSRVLHVSCALLVLLAGIYGNFGVLYWVGAALFTAMLWYQHSLVKPDDLRKVNIAFMTANGIASVCFALFLCIDLFKFF
jgi:4-hydroxybenzoate polyprenyltransferase